MNELILSESETVPLLTRQEFHALADVPPELEWFADIDCANTRRAYFRDVKDFMEFVGVGRPEDFRLVTRAHIIQWRKVLQARNLAPATIRRKLSALGSLFNYLCERNAITHNPVQGVSRPKGKSEPTKSLSDDQVKILLNAPPIDTLKGKRDRAILSVLLYHAPRREEVCKLRVKDYYVLDRGVPHLRIRGKGEKDRYIPLHPATIGLIQEYLDVLGHGAEKESPLFRPVKSNTPTEEGGDPLERALSPNSIQQNIVKYYAEKTGIYFEGVSPHALRKTAATNALEHEADINRVKDWLGHADISTTEIYDGRGTRPEDSPTFKVAY